ncbi:hypothetical protein ACFL08_00730 [Patescibacteria group bacterium]
MSVRIAWIGKELKTRKIRGEKVDSIVFFVGETVDDSSGNVLSLMIDSNHSCFSPVVLEDGGYDTIALWRAIAFLERFDDIDYWHIVMCWSLMISEPGSKEHAEVAMQLAQEMKVPMMQFEAIFNGILCRVPTDEDKSAKRLFSPSSDEEVID